MSVLSPALPEIKVDWRWVFGVPTWADLDAGRAALEISSHTQKGEVRAYYLVRALRDEKGKLHGFRLLKEERGGFSETYDIDTSFGADCRAWSCDCRDFHFRRGRNGYETCKHCRAAHAAVQQVKE